MLTAILAKPSTSVMLLHYQQICGTDHKAHERAEKSGDQGRCEAAISGNKHGGLTPDKLWRSRETLIKEGQIRLTWQRSSGEEWVYGRDGIQGMTGVLGKWILGKNGAGKAWPWLLVNKRAGRGNTNKSAHGPVV